ncbi:MAG: galactose-1-phosphate uridylyltransferase [Candidatus Edwardsbacteria bacterium]
MSELRQNPATKEWVIIATERAKRPEDFPKTPSPPSAELPKFCPFCPGNEDSTPPEVLSYRKEGTEPNKSGWWIRVIRNRFAALTPDGSLERKELGFFRSMDGVGHHEVVIEMPEHHKSITTAERKQVEEIILAYRERYLALVEDPRVQLVIIFKNHGKAAGSSLEHPHSQIVATPIVPGRIRERIEAAIRHYDDHGACVYCEIMKEEKNEGKRIVLENDDFFVFEPFAPRSPFETWVLPKRHSSTFGQITIDEAKNLAAILQTTLKKVHSGLGNPDYNFVIHTAPKRDVNEEYYHWHIQIILRLSIPAGFEMGSGIYINVIPPEECARFLREID